MGTTTWMEDTTLRSPELVSRIEVGLAATGVVRGVADRPVAEAKGAVVNGIKQVNSAIDAQKTLVRREKMERIEDSGYGIKYGAAWMKPMKEIGKVLGASMDILMKQLDVVNREIRAATRGIGKRLTLWLEQHKEKEALRGAMA